MDLAPQPQPAPALAPVEPDATEALVLRQLAHGDLEDASCLVESQGLDYNLPVTPDIRSSRRLCLALVAVFLAVESRGFRQDPHADAQRRAGGLVQEALEQRGHPAAGEVHRSVDLHRRARLGRIRLPAQPRVARDDRVGHEDDLVGRRAALSRARVQVPHHALAPGRHPRRDPAGLAPRGRRGRPEHLGSLPRGRLLRDLRSMGAGPETGRNPAGFRGIWCSTPAPSTGSTATRTGPRTAIRAGTRRRSPRSPTTTIASSCPSESGALPGAPANVTIDPDTDVVQALAVARTLGKSAKIRIAVSRPVGSDMMTVSGTVPSRYFRWAVPVAINDPPKFFGAALKSRLRAAGNRAHGQRRRAGRQARQLVAAGREHRVRARADHVHLEQAQPELLRGADLQDPGLREDRAGGPGTARSAWPSSSWERSASTPGGSSSTTARGSPRATASPRGTSSSS